MLPGTPSIRLLCVDDHHLVREGLILIINREPDLDVVATAATGEEGVALFQRHRPDVTLMDLRLPGMSGLEAVRAIRGQSLDARIIVLTTCDDNDNNEGLYQALQAGAAAYLFKNTLSDDLIRVIREVHAGERMLSSEMIEVPLAERARPQLTPRELEVLTLIAQAMRNKEIAAVLGVSQPTVEVHVKNIFAKLEVHDRTAAVRVALRRGIVQIK